MIIKLEDNTLITEDEIQQCINLLPKKFQKLDCKITIGDSENINTYLEFSDWVGCGTAGRCVGDFNITIHPNADYEIEKAKNIRVFAITDYIKYEKNWYKPLFILILYHEIYHAYQMITHRVYYKDGKVYCNEPPAYRFCFFWSLLKRKQINKILGTKGRESYSSFINWFSDIIKWYRLIITV